MNFSTIAAISTPHGLGGVALIRVSGIDAFEICEKMFIPCGNKKFGDFPFRHAIYGDILSGDGKTVIDDGLITLFNAPNSFTGENVCEICCHGGEVITSMVLSSVLENGAVMAKRGEFSERAFINGKMTLSSAEGIADLLDAKTEDAAILSSSSARGKLSEKLNEITDETLKLSASLWAYIDYPEEDLQTMSDDELIGSIDSVIESTEKLIDSYKTGRAINNGINTVIIGKPNAGKSTFFNKLLGENKAIVTDIAGTTRDIIEYPVKLGRVLINLADTAGIRENTDDKIEIIGIEKVKEAVKDAEMIFALFDSSRKLDENDDMVIQCIKEISGATVIPIITKCDLERKIDVSKIESISAPLFTGKDSDDFAELTEIVEKIYISDEKMLREGGIIVNARQKSLAVKARDLLCEAKQNIINRNKDIASLTLENAVGVLKEIDGQSVGETILNEVFSRFCIGK